jgi:hypothetical protein
MPRTMLVFSLSELPEPLQDDIRKVATEGFGMPDDSYLSWVIGREGEGAEYITARQVRVIHKFLLKNGGELGQEVLIET